MKGSSNVDPSYGSIDFLFDQERNTTTVKKRKEHLGKHRQYWRDIILGVNDGLISIYLLVAGVVGSGLTTTDILLTAIAGALAGAVSMSAGEFIATKSQNEVLQGEIGLERVHIRENNRDEISEAVELLETIGISACDNAELHEMVLLHYERSPDALLKLMVALEFGFIEEEERSPIMAAFVSGFLFFLGSLPSLLAFVPSHLPPAQCLAIATIATITMLLIVGGIKTWATRGSCIESAMENLVVAGLGGCLAYVVGAWFDQLIH